jgi:hypothetical protein
MYIYDNISLNFSYNEKCFIKKSVEENYINTLSPITCFRKSCLFEITRKMWFKNKGHR